ncbi:hypothetical protein PM082_024973 [Marasmius tenuissimus]|nr:hypothetical protein PM082_024973 [Marasmius tenuissimus]
MDSHAYDFNIKTAQLLNEQKKVLDNFACTWGDRNHGPRLRFYITKGTKIIDDNLKFARIEDVVLPSRDTVFSCRLHKIDYEWDGKSQTEFVLEVIKLFLVKQSDFDGPESGDEVNHGHILRVLDEE